MDWHDVVLRRRMVRRYTGEPVDPVVLERILDAARRGPSAGNTQALTLVVVTDRRARQRVALACGEADHVARGRRPWISSAPVLVVPCTSPAAYAARYAEPDKRGEPPGDVPWWWVDVGAALMLLLLAATAEGLAAGLLAAPRDALVQAVDLAPDEVPLGVVTIGHPHPQERPTGSALRPRRPLDEVVRRLG